MPDTKRSYGGILDPATHVERTYGHGWEVVLQNEVLDFASYTSAWFGGHNTCTITTLTAVFSHHAKTALPGIESDPKELYRIIEGIGRRRRYYLRAFGTLPFFIDDLARATWRHFGYDGTAHTTYFLFDDSSLAPLLMDEVDAGRPGAISFTHGSYAKHTVTFHGYRIFERGRDLRAYLLVNDNWRLDRRWVDLTDIAGIGGSFIGVTRITPPVFAPDRLGREGRDVTPSI